MVRVLLKRKPRKPQSRSWILENIVYQKGQFDLAGLYWCNVITWLFGVYILNFL